jgi:hypothetical protein
LPWEAGADRALTDCVATGSVATGSVATGFVAGEGVATSCDAAGREPGGCAAAAGGVVADVDWGLVADSAGAGWVAGACRAERRVTTRCLVVESASEGCVGTVVVVVAGGAVALVGAPAESSLPTGEAPPIPAWADSSAGVGNPGSAGAAGVVTWTSFWRGVVRRLAAERPVGVNTAPDAVAGAGVPMLLGDREARLESTVVPVPSTRPRTPFSGPELAPTGTEAEAPFDTVEDAVVPATATSV